MFLRRLTLHLEVDDKFLNSDQIPFGMVFVQVDNHLVAQEQEYDIRYTIHPI